VVLGLGFYSRSKGAEESVAVYRGYISSDSIEGCNSVSESEDESASSRDFLS
jgi:hypothetical protein